MPIVYHEQGLDERLVDYLNIWTKAPDLSGWERIVKRVKEPASETTIAIVGKYVELTESYKSLAEALIHGGIGNDCRVYLKYVDSEALERHGINDTFDQVDGILVRITSYNVCYTKLLRPRWTREEALPEEGMGLWLYQNAIRFIRQELAP